VRPNRRPLTVAAISLTAVVALASCGDDGSGADEGADATAPTATEPVPPASEPAPPASDATVAPSAPAADTPTTSPPVAVPAALQFSAPLVGGGTLDASTLAGRPTLFWFWAPT
jgi:hypothetical protein